MRIRIDQPEHSEMTRTSSGGPPVRTGRHEIETVLPGRPPLHRGPHYQEELAAVAMLEVIKDRAAEFEGC